MPTVAGLVILCLAVGGTHTTVTEVLFTDGVFSLTPRKAEGNAYQTLTVMLDFVEQDTAGTPVKTVTAHEWNTTDECETLVNVGCTYHGMLTLSDSSTATVALVLTSNSHDASGIFPVATYTVVNGTLLLTADVSWPTGASNHLFMKFSSSWKAATAANFWDAQLSSWPSSIAYVPEKTSSGGLSSVSLNSVFHTTMDFPESVTANGAAHAASVTLATGSDSMVVSWDMGVPATTMTGTFAIRHTRGQYSDGPFSILAILLLLGVAFVLLVLLGLFLLLRYKRLCCYKKRSKVVDLGSSDEEAALLPPGAAPQKDRAAPQPGGGKRGGSSKGSSRGSFKGSSARPSRGPSSNRGPSKGGATSKGSSKASDKGASKTSSKGTAASGAAGTTSGAKKQPRGGGAEPRAVAASTKKAQPKAAGQANAQPKKGGKAGVAKGEKMPTKKAAEPAVDEETTVEPESSVDTPPAKSKPSTKVEVKVDAQPGTTKVQVKKKRVRVKDKKGAAAPGPANEGDTGETEQTEEPAKAPPTKGDAGGAEPEPSESFVLEREDEFPTDSYLTEDWMSATDPNSESLHTSDFFSDNPDMPRVKIRRNPKT